MTPLTVLALACTAQAADPPKPIETALAERAVLAPPAVESVFYDEPGDGRVWVRGADYKASFGPEGATFVPFLGSRAPRNFPVAFALEGATVGGEPLALSPEAAVVREDGAVRLERGEVCERYLVELGWLEQTFELDALPSRGELVLTVGVETELEPERDGAGWRFRGPSGGVDYGAAVAFDATGARVEVESRWTGRALELVVPAAFVADAALPLVVDPVISSGTIADLNSEERSPDVAYDVDNGVYFVVVEYVFSASDSDIRAYEVDSNTSTLLGTNGIWLDVTTEKWTEPAVANRRVGHTFMTVATVGTGLARTIGGRVRDLDGPTLGNPFTVSGTLSDCSSPDIGGDGRPGPFTDDWGYTVVWEKTWTPGVDSDIYYRVFNWGGVPLTLPEKVDSSFLTDDRNPSIAKSTGRSSPYGFTVVWELALDSQHQWVQARQLSFFGTLVGPTFTVHGTGFSAEPDVATKSEVQVPGQSEDATVVVFRNSASFGAPSRILGAVCSGSVVHSVTDLTEAEGARPDRWHRSPAVSCDGDQWLVAYSEQFGTTADFDVYQLGADLVGDRLGLTESHINLAFDASVEGEVASASRWAAGESTTVQDGNGALTVWTDDGVSSSRIEGAHVMTSTVSACGAQYCEANPNSTGNRGWVAAFGDQATSTGKVLVASRLPQDVASFFLTSASTDFVPFVAGSEGNLCLGLTGFGRYSNHVGPATGGVYVLQVDPTQIPQPNGTVAAQVGQTWYFQCWHRDTDGMGGATSNLTNAVAVPFL